MLCQCLLSALAHDGFVHLLEFLIHCDLGLNVLSFHPEVVQFVLTGTIWVYKYCINYNHYGLIVTWDSILNKGDSICLFL